MHGEVSHRERPGDLVIERAIVEADLGSIVAGVRVPDAVQSCPEDGTEAHRTGFAACQQFATGKAERFELLTGVADGHDLCMGRRIVGRGDTILSATDHGAVMNHDCSERSAPGFDRFDGEADCFPHPGFLPFGVSMSCVVHHSMGLLKDVTEMGRPVHEWQDERLIDGGKRFSLPMRSPCLLTFPSLAEEESPGIMRRMTHLERQTPRLRPRQTPRLREISRNLIDFRFILHSQDDIQTVHL